MITLLIPYSYFSLRCMRFWFASYCNLRIRILTSCCWGMSRRGRRDVKEVIVRVEHSGVFGVHEHGLEVRDKRSENSSKWFE
jgi:hypothetical protein